MRLALVVTGGFDRSGRDRVIPSLLWLTERLSRRHTVVVYVLRYHDTPCRYELAGATVCDLGRPEGVRRQTATLLSAMRHDAPFDVVHGYWAHPPGLAVALAARRLGIPSVVTCDSGEFVGLQDIGYGLQRNWRSRAAVALATRLATAVTVCSEYQAALARRHRLAPVVIPLGVDCSLFPAAAPRASDGPVRLLTVASLNPVKDHGTLLRALRLLVTHGHRVALDIVGEDTLDGRVQRLVTELGLDGGVAFHGFVPSERLAPYYAAADLFVLSSRHEAAGVVVLEAAASGLPIVGSAVGYVADWSPSMACGVEPGRPEALAAAIARLLESEERRAAMSRLALDWTRAHDADWSAAQFDRLYHELVSQTRRPAPE
jgi:glycosyltransferase involved in cell wall biosynthesis